MEARAGVFSNASQRAEYSTYFESSFAERRDAKCTDKVLRVEFVSHSCNNPEREFVLRYNPEQILVCEDSAE